MDVPPEGDCWLLALLAPLLGYVVKEDRDQQNIIPTVRRRMAEIVTAASKQFVHLFGGNQKELETWAQKIQRWSPGDSQEKWGGTQEFLLFAQITGICVHVINRENQRWEPAVQHLVPRSFQKTPWRDEDWTVSVVVVYGDQHYQVLVPETLPLDVTITEGTTDAKGLKALIDIRDSESDGEEDVFTPTVVQTSQKHITKYFKR